MKIHARYEPRLRHRYATVIPKGTKGRVVERREGKAWYKNGCREPMCEYTARLDGSIRYVVEWELWERANNNTELANTEWRRTTCRTQMRRKQLQRVLNRTRRAWPRPSRCWTLETGQRVVLAKRLRANGINTAGAIPEGTPGVIDQVSDSGVKIRFDNTDTGPSTASASPTRTISVGRSSLNILDVVTAPLGPPEEKTEPSVNGPTPTEPNASSVVECPCPSSKRGMSVMLAFEEIDPLGRSHLDVATMQELCASFAANRPDISEMWKTMTGRMAWGESAAGHVHNGTTNPKASKHTTKKKHKERTSLRAAMRAAKMARIKDRDDTMQSNLDAAAAAPLPGLSDDDEEPDSTISPKAGHYSRRVTVSDTAVLDVALAAQDLPLPDEEGTAEHTPRQI